MYTDLSLYIDGRWLRGEHRPEIEVLNPADGSTLGGLPLATAADLNSALAAAEKAFPRWKSVSAADRSKILRKAAELLRQRSERVARIQTLEEGKCYSESRGEVLGSAEVIEWYAEEGRRTYGRVVPSRQFGTRQLVVQEPVGVVAAFSPWNFPTLTPVRKIAGALASGCPIIIKASEETPGACVELVRCFADAGLPDGVLNLVFGVPEEVSEFLIRSPIVRKVSFTGSISVGKRLAALAAKGMKRATMELGGHAPVVVFDDADPEKVADVIATLKFRNAGQICISPSRFFVQDSSYSRFVERFADYAKGLKLGNGLEKGVTMGPLANRRRVSEMERFVEDAVLGGGRVVTGGKRAGNHGYFYEPTVLTEVSDNSKIMTEEPFGPVAPIVPFKTFDEVVERANSLGYGLAAYAFTSSASTAAAIGSALKVGMVGVNSVAIGLPETPFGGINDSGYGSEGGTEGLHAYLNTKLISQA
ncbi:MAG TPA: NAD-dependent succinate-semialdehyde dehydrogenase [Pseudolabrys sp.]|jgi:succinate-semialdehyde dehydrogenase/glutarate-semialdehyde dehydrogenase|nr:NAD-dependent succinate-semialdehyde dehydrogenase [Pseudolabrys sp.]